MSRSPRRTAPLLPVWLSVTHSNADAQIPEWLRRTSRCLNIGSETLAFIMHYMDLSSSKAFLSFIRAPDLHDILDYQPRHFVKEIDRLQKAACFDRAGWGFFIEAEIPHSVTMVIPADMDGAPVGARIQCSHGRTIDTVGPLDEVDVNVSHECSDCLRELPRTHEGVEIFQSPTTGVRKVEFDLLVHYFGWNSMATLKLVHAGDHCISCIRGPHVHRVCCHQRLDPAAAVRFEEELCLAGP